MKRAFLVLLVIAFSCTFAGISHGAVIQGIRYWSNERYTRVVLDVNTPVEFTQNRISNPDRLFFDLKGCIMSDEIKTILPISDNILRSARAAQFDKNTVRVVLDLESFESFNVMTLHEPFRIIIDVYGNGKAPSTPPRGEKQKITGIRKVLIDPGHGGKDTGAVGPNGLYEKDVVLSVSKKLGKILNERYNIEAIFTREDDVFIPLEERTAVANSKKVDLFISIHANASPYRSVRGIETYILNWTNDEGAMRVAARENAISLKKMRKVQGDLQIILQDLARDSKRDESLKLAHNVQVSLVSALKEDYKEITDLGVKHALFYVLVGAEMPSILAEISFISNNEEEKRLSEDDYRSKIAEAIARGIDEYVAPSKLVKRDSDKL
ncbi:MAG: N-acetylmuramoyl-L-alanine amidase [Nitrospirae bacterium]|nr:N-acetylmuramoyl-L-alanine amidase [Nitrospirota bacterium]